MRRAGKITFSLFLKPCYSKCPGRMPMCVGALGQARGTLALRGPIVTPGTIIPCVGLKAALAHGPRATAGSAKPVSL